MRILLICHALAPESVGGVEQHVDGLARALTADGHDVHVYTRTGRPGPAAGERIAEPVTDPTVRPYPVTRVVYRHEGLETLVDLYRCDLLDRAFEGFLAEQPRFDVVHIHHFTGISTGIMPLLAARGLPRVVTLHDYWIMCPRGQMWNRQGQVTTELDPAQCRDCLRPPYDALVPEGAAGRDAVAAVHSLARTTLDAATMLLAPSARVRPAFELLGIDPARIRIVENGVDTSALGVVPPPPRVTQGPDAPLRIGYLGTLLPSKGLDVLIRAYRRLPQGRATLAIHGNAVPYHGDESFLTRAFAPLTPTDNVTYFGPYGTEDLPRLLADIDVLVAPARWEEAYGLTVREGLAAGRPVIVSRIGGLQDAVVDGTGGRVVTPGDEDNLAAVLRELVDSPTALQDLAADARRAGGERGFAEMAKDLIDAYQAAIALEPAGSEP